MSTRQFVNPPRRIDKLNLIQPINQTPVGRRQTIEKVVKRRLQPSFEYGVACGYSKNKAPHRCTGLCSFIELEHQTASDKRICCQSFFHIGRVSKGRV